MSMINHPVLCRHGRLVFQYLTTIPHSKKMTGMNFPGSPKRIDVCKACKTIVRQFMTGIKAWIIRPSKQSSYLTFIALNIHLQDNSGWRYGGKNILKKDGIHPFLSSRPCLLLFWPCHLFQLVLAQHFSCSGVFWKFVEQVENTSPVAAILGLLQTSICVQIFCKKNHLTALWINLTPRFPHKRFLSRLLLM